MRAFAVIAVSSLSLSACAGLIGLSDYSTEPEAALEAGSDGATTPLVDARDDARDAAAPEDARPDDANAPPDAEVDSGPLDESTCANVTPLAVSKAYHAAANAITVDGITTEWPCAWRSHLDATNAQKVLLDAKTSVDFATAWNDSGVYFMARGHFLGALATVDTANPYRNDAVELYFSAIAPAPTGIQSVSDLHLVVDYANRRALYSKPGAPPQDAGIYNIVTATKPTADGFALEVFIPRGATVLAEGQALRFDVQLDAHGVDGNRQILFLYLSDPGGVKGDCYSLALSSLEPSCNTRVWGGLSLVP